MRGNLGIRAVWSPEESREPLPLAYDGEEGFHCVCPGGKNEHHSCEERSLVRGSVSFVTGTFGLVAAMFAGVVMNQLVLLARHAVVGWHEQMTVANRS